MNTDNRTGDEMPYDSSDAVAAVQDRVRAAFQVDLRFVPLQVSDRYRRAVTRLTRAEVTLSKVRALYDLRAAEIGARPDSDAEGVFLDRLAAILEGSSSRDEQMAHEFDN